MALMTDTFTDTAGTALTAHTADTGETYTLLQGSDSVDCIAGGLIQDVGGTGPYYRNTFVPITADYRVKLIDISSAASWHTGPGGRLDAGVVGYAMFWDGSNTVWRMYDVASGSFNSIATGGGSGDDPNSNAKDVEIEFTGTTITCSVGNTGSSLTQIISVVNSSVTAANSGGFIAVADSAERISGMEIEDPIVAGGLSAGSLSMMGVGV